MSISFLILLVVLLLVGPVLLFVFQKKSFSESPSLEITSEEVAFADLLGYKIENPSTITYLDLGRMGRMGNQLFEIATTVAIAKQNRCRVVFPEATRQLPLYELFDMKLPLRFELKANQVLRERSNFDEIVVPPNGRIYSLEGYRQSVKYLEPIRDQLKLIFPLKKEEKKRQIAIHIRRTDCIKTGRVQKFIDAPLNCSLDYYRAAIKRLKRLHRLPRDYPVVVVTDDRKWAQDELSKIDPAAKLSSGGTLVDDFFSLTSSNYLVISNSTFSLWGGLLGRASEVIAPSYWFHPDNKIVRLLGSDGQHLCPRDWLFNDPITGVIIEKAYDWPDQVPCRLQEIIRSVIMSNRFRK